MIAGISGNAIYSPPKERLPRLVVAIKDGEIAGMVLANSRDEARALIVAQRTAGNDADQNLGLTTP